MKLMANNTSRVRFSDRGNGEDGMGPGGGQTQRSAHSHRRLSEKEINALPPQLRSKLINYDNPPKEIADQQTITKKRVLEKVKIEKLKSQPPPPEEEMERAQHEKLIGQLKAAEARNRIRITRLRYESGRGDEIGHLVASQPTAAMAVRLEALLPIKKQSHTMNDPLDKVSRDRIERLMDDEQGILTGRT